LIPPFPQLGRGVEVLKPEEESATELVRHRGRAVPALTMASLLKAHGWSVCWLKGARRSEAHAKTFDRAGVTAVLHHANLDGQNYPRPGSRQELTRVFFVKAGGKPPHDSEQAVALGTVELLVRTEVMEMLALLAAKGK
jgi:hypothetical protein